MYLATNPLFDLMAATTAGAGYGTYHGGPINMQQVLTLFGKDKDTPVSYGQPISLEPMSAFPLQWRIETDEFLQAQDLPDSDMPLSVCQSDQLIAKILKRIARCSCRCCDRSCYQSRHCIATRTGAHQSY